MADRATVELSDTIESDLATFTALLAETSEHDHAEHDVCPACLPVLEKATSLYRGPFLAGFSLRDAPEFEDWVRPVAENLRQRCASALERLAIGCAALGDYRRAVDVSSRWIELDPLHEPAHRQLMLLTAWVGDRAGSIEAYRRCVSVLNDELGVSPLEETTELYEAILDDDLPPAPGVRRTVRSATTPEPHTAAGGMIDRRGQLDLLEHELMWASTGGRVVLITGDAWMGKTRLVEEFGTSAAARGHRVLYARGYRAEQELPYGAVIQLLRMALSVGWIDANSLPNWVTAEATRLVPELGGSGLDSNVLGEVRLYEALTAVLLGISPNRVLVLGIDDGQWLDRSSVSFLSYLAHRIDRSGVLILLATRSGERAAAASDYDVFDFAGTVIHLDPFTVDDIVGNDIDPDGAEGIITATGGIPMLVADRLGDVDDALVTTGVNRYIEDRLRSLDELSVQIVATASVLDGFSSVAMLRAVSGRSSDEVVDSVDRLVAARVLRSVPGTGGVGFVLEAMQTIVYGSLTPVRRQHLHRRAAQAIATGFSADRDLGAARSIAEHHRASGQEAEARSWFITAGRLANAVYAHAEAEGAFRSALALHPDDPGPVYLGLGDAFLLDARFSEAREAYQSASAGGDTGTRALAEHRLGDVHRRLGRFDQAEHHFLLAEELHPDPTSLYADWALLDQRRGDTTTAADRARRAVTLAAEGGDRRAEARARNVLGIVVDDRSELERALELAADDPAIRMATLNSLAYAEANDGNLDRADALVSEAILLAEDVGDRHRRAALLNHAADIHHRAGREEESRAAFTAAVTLFAEVQQDAWEPEVWLLTRW